MHREDAFWRPIYAYEDNSIQPFAHIKKLSWTLLKVKQFHEITSSDTKPTWYLESFC